MARDARPKSELPIYEAVNTVINRLFGSRVDGSWKVPPKIVDTLRRSYKVVGRKLKWGVGQDWFSPENDSERRATMAVLHDMLEEIRSGLGSLVIASSLDAKQGTNAYAIRVYEDEALHRKEVVRIARLAARTRNEEASQ